ncbi:MAG: hypothetical protein ABIG71_02620 [Candidatus Uhrbacteria bacterium]
MSIERRNSSEAEPITNILDDRKRFNDRFRQNIDDYVTHFFSLNIPEDQLLWSRNLQEAFLPAELPDWERERQNTYYESVGRLLAGADMISSILPVNYSAGLRHELLRLQRSCADVSDVDLGRLFQLSAVYAGYAIDTNTAGGQRGDITNRISATIPILDTMGAADAAELLVNPHRLSAGTKLLRFDRDTKGLIIETIDDVLVEGTDSIALVEDEAITLHKLNVLLARGERATFDGESVFGGAEKLREIVAPYEQPGTVITHRPFNPLMRRDAETLVVSKSNLASLRAQYGGDGFLAFFKRFPVERPLVVIQGYAQGANPDSAREIDIRYVQEILTWEAPNA